MKKKILVCGGGGFIGHHLARRLYNEGHYVVVVDIKEKNEYAHKKEFCTVYLPGDLTGEWAWDQLDGIYHGFDEIYQLAADMGGAGYIFTGENDFNVMTNSAQINLHAVKWAVKWKSKIFYSSSACMYPAYNQEDPNNPKCSEDSAYPAAPDSEYGWEKLFSERLYLAAHKNYGLNVRIARFHNIYGPEGTWDGGKEKAPAALCRKVAIACKNSEQVVDVWGPGTQTRSFLFINDCVDAVLKLMESNFIGPVNIGSEEMISINDLAKMITQLPEVSNQNIKIINIEGPVGVMGRNSDNTLIKQKLGWEPKTSLREGIEILYRWINKNILA